jgi:hypothetical protein
VAEPSHLEFPRFQLCADWFTKCARHDLIVVDDIAPAVDFNVAAPRAAPVVIEKTIEVTPIWVEIHGRTPGPGHGLPQFSKLKARMVQP